MSKKLGLISIAALLAMLLTAGQSAFADSITTTANGTWDAYPGNSSTFQTSVQQPINADGSSNFKANGKTVIPVKFALSQGSGAFVFESLLASGDYSFLNFTPSTPVTFNQITQLSAVYVFTTGNCHGGSLRWSVSTSSGNLHIYYGDEPNTTDCTTHSQSGTNMIGLSDLRYDTSQFVGGSFYDTYTHAQTLIGTMPILGATLVLDSGWGGDQVLTLSSATFGTVGYTDTFTPQPASALSPVCPSQEATIKISKISGTPTGDVNEPLTIQPQDNNGIFRIVDCKYMYNLATSSLSGVGTYSVYAVINGTPVSNPAMFDLR